MSGWLPRKTAQQVREEQAQVNRFDRFNYSTGVAHYGTNYVPAEAIHYANRSWPPVRGALEDSDDEVEH